ncbi:MAG: hypothetical protein MNPFHGCM_00408 [Gemmatimonadaceae bacterium]|nr:hypothetical protein [Gemmatimonadaceae bacterium]
MFTHSPRLMGVVTLFALATACRDDPVRPPPVRPASPELDAARVPSPPAIQGDLIRFDRLSDEALWAEIRNAGGTAEIGLRRSGQRHGMANGRVLISRPERDVVVRDIGTVAGISVRSADTLLPIASVRVASLAALSALRKHRNVSFIEPGRLIPVAGNSKWLSSGSGCSVGFYNGPGGSTIISPGDLLPWNYHYMNIPAAWARVPGGAGVTIGIVDTGIDSYQPELTTEFATGMSTGRTHVIDATAYAHQPVYWHDTCGHGTRLASVVAGPRNGKSILGVAWKANLYSVRVDDDVVLTNVAATRLGIRLAAGHAKLIAMAFGTIAYYQSISDELSYWYALDKMFVAAAGTSVCFGPQRSIVTFPGSEPTVTTVTGLDRSGAVSCDSHYGPAVDFAAFVDQPVTGVASLGTVPAGFGGSSNAVGVITGLAALELSRNPNQTRSELVTALAYAASPTGLRSNMTGWGSPNAMCVVGGVCAAFIQGTDLIQTYGTRTYSWTAWQAAAPPWLVSYQWNTGQSTPTISRTVTVTPGMQEYTLVLAVTVRDNVDGSTRTVTKNVLVRDPYNCPTCW